MGVGWGAFRRWVSVLPGVRSGSWERLSHRWAEWNGGRGGGVGFFC